MGLDGILCDSFDSKFRFGGFFCFFFWRRCHFSFGNSFVMLARLPSDDSRFREILSMILANDKRFLNALPF